MNIYALKGHKVKFTNPSAGYKFYEENASKYLKLEEEYTIVKTKVYSCNTDVWLQEVPDIYFNSCQFEDVQPQNEDKDMLHPDYSRYN